MLQAKPGNLLVMGPEDVIAFSRHVEIIPLPERFPRGFSISLCAYGLSLLFYGSDGIPGRHLSKNSVERIDSRNFLVDSCFPLQAPGENKENL